MDTYIDQESATILDDTVYGFVAAMNHAGYELRYNTRMSISEVKYASRGWLPFTDKEEAILRETLRTKYFRPNGVRYNIRSEDMRHFCNVLAGRNSIDPFREYLGKLPTWDGILRVEKLFENLFPGSDGPLNEFVSKYIFLAAIYRAFEPGYKADIMPVIKGPQGAGKSTFIEYLTPVGSGWFREGVSFRNNDKILVESILGAVHVEFAEIAGMRRSSIDRLKAFITRRNDNNIRLAYERRPDNIPRRCVFIGTTNAEQPLPYDVSGNRRFLVVVVNDSIGTEKIRDYLEKTRDMLWAEALNMHKNRVAIYLNNEEEALQHNANQQFRASDVTIEDALSMTVWKRETYTLGDVMVYSSIASHRSRTHDVSLQTRVMSSMIMLGWVKTKGGRWRPPRSSKNNALLTQKK